MHITKSMWIFLALWQSTIGFYIKPTGEKPNTKTLIQAHKDDWQVFQKKLGLTKQKVDLLKAQKDQQGTKELLHRYMKENPQFVTKAAEKPASDDKFMHIYRNLIKQLKMSTSMMKTSLNFELADKPLKNLKRSRRKIAVKMVSDMPTEQIDGLLQMFYQKEGINRIKYNTAVDDDDLDYGEADMPSPAVVDPDYMYENFYDDAEDVALSAKSRQSSEYGSFQDLILQAKRNQWEHENEETKLSNPINEHFV